MKKKKFNNKLVMAIKGNEDFKNSTKFWICDSDYVDGNVKARYHCHIIRKYRGSELKDCNVKLKLNHKITTALKIMAYILLCKN